MTEVHSTLDVALGERSYPIHIGAGLIDRADELLAPCIPLRRTVIITDENLARTQHPVHLVAALERAGIASRTYVLPVGEATKSFRFLEQVVDEFLSFGMERRSTVIALGGGVIGDLVGFAAAATLRGIDFIQVPTTLLAQVDSAVGGKTGINTRQGKNLVGAFHPPRAVIADTATLRTLPPRELRAGFAEVIKYGAIIDAPFLDWLEAHADALLAGDDALLAEAIARSCRHKAAITERDPFEHGERALLNFGHTFGHAIETEQGYGGLNHGEAVAVGMVLAARLSSARGLADAADGERLRGLLQRFELPAELPAGLDPAALVARMRLDKKAQGSGLRFVLWDGAGKARVVADVDEAAVQAVLQDR